MTQFAVRPAAVGDAPAMAELFAAVAAERDGIATEPPVDVGQRAAQFAASVATSLVALAGGQVIGMLHVEISRHGFGEISMLVDRDWRGRRANGELWDSIIMGLALPARPPGPGTGPAIGA
jgi:L-amino acid N-acyltransferase YncA